MQETGASKGHRGLHLPSLPRFNLMPDSTRCFPFPSSVSPRPHTATSPYNPSMHRMARAGWAERRERERARAGGGLAGYDSSLALAI